MRRTWTACVGVGVLSVMLSGCVMARTYRDHPLDEQKIASIEPGVTTKAEVLERLGPPQEIDPREITAVNLSPEPFEPLPERVVASRYFRYTYTRGNGQALIALLFNYLEFDEKSDSLVIFFDDQNKVQAYAFVKDTALLPRYGFLSR
jgi:hypothetical protein